MAGAYYCFNEFSQVEQFEAGDTLHHNFWIPTWSAIEPGWYLFTAKVAGEWSPSVSCIFHCLAPAPVPFSNGGFESWEHPDNAPWRWYHDRLGPGTVDLIRDDVQVHTGLYSARLDATGAGTHSLLKQYFCVHDLIGQTVTFTAYTGGGVGGQVRITVYIPFATGFSVLMGPHGYWRRYRRTFTVRPGAYWGYIHLSSLAQTAGMTTAGFDTLSIA